MSLSNSIQRLTDSFGTTNHPTDRGISPIIGDLADLHERYEGEL